MSLRDEILGADDLPRLAIEIPEWGRTVTIRMMTAGERDRFEIRQRRDEFVDFRARIAVATICDEEGKLVFTEADIPAMTDKSSAALDRIFGPAIKLNKMSREDIEELQGNFTNGPSDGSSSSLPSPSAKMSAKLKPGHRH